MATTTTSDSKPDIVTVISRYLELTKKGRELVGLRPFHQDTKPSLQVNPEKQIHKCFACGAGGDVYDFVQAYCQVDFKESKRIAAVGGGDYADPVQREVMREKRQSKITPERAQAIADDEHVRALLEPPGLGHLAAKLGVAKDTLTDLRCGKHADKQWSFPMRDANRSIVGIRIRHEDEGKWAISGSSEGLFLPMPFPTEHFGPLLVCEGPTDTAAALTLFYLAFGRPSCNGAHDLCVELIRRTKSNEVWIVSDPDIHGVNGAEKLADEICNDRPTKLIVPGKGKDLRTWVQEGADRDWMERTARDVDYYRKDGGK